MSYNEFIIPLTFAEVFLFILVPSVCGCSVKINVIWKLPAVYIFLIYVTKFAEGGYVYFLTFVCILFV